VKTESVSENSAAVLCADSVQPRKTTTAKNKRFFIEQELMC
jgi:hypothetical protein